MAFFLRIFIIGFLSGVLLNAFFALETQPPCFSSQNVVFQGVIDDLPEIFEDKTRLVAKIDDRRVHVYAPLYPEFSYGDVLEIHGIPKPPPTHAREICAVFSFTKIHRIKTHAGDPLKSLLFRIREYFYIALSRVFHEPRASLASAMLLGNHGGGEWQAVFRKSGLSHLTALSGFNITILIIFIDQLFGVFDRRMRFWLSLLMITIFVLLTGASPSVTRAALMGSLFLFAKTIGRRAHAFHTLLVTLFIMVLFNPNFLLYDLGFQLSFLATFGLIVAAPRLSRLLPPLKKAAAVREILLSTLAAQIFTLPLVIIAFQSYNPLSIVANILVLPTVPFIMGLVFLAALFGQIPGFYADLLLRWMLAVAEFFAHFSFSW